MRARVAVSLAGFFATLAILIQACSSGSGTSGTPNAAGNSGVNTTGGSGSVQPNGGTMAMSGGTGSAQAGSGATQAGGGQVGAGGTNAAAGTVATGGAISLGELVREDKFGPCNCYSSPANPNDGNGCGQLNAFEVVNDNNSSQNFDLFSTNFFGYAGYVGEGPCGKNCNLTGVGLAT